MGIPTGNTFGSRCNDDRASGVLEETQQSSSRGFTRGKFFAAAGGSIGACLAVGSAWAQQAAPTTAADAASGGLAEITVTAERRDENLQRVPISATVLDGAQLAERGVVSVQELQYQTPGLSIQPALNAETFINIRGVGIQQVNPTSSNGVSFYVDGVYIPSLIDTVDTFYDLNNVEVLRGPQGTLVGSNSDGGAIFVNSVQPTFDSVKGYFQQTLGNYNDRRSEGAINLPISDQLAVRVAFVIETQDSFTTNVGEQPPTGNPSTTSNQPGNVDFEAVRLQLAYKPSEDFELTLRYEPYQSKTDGYAVKPDMNAVTPTSSVYDPYAASIQNKPFMVDYDTPQYFNITGQRYSGTAVWHITDGVELKSVTSNQSGNESDQRDIDDSSAPANLFSDRRTAFNTFTQEINLLSTTSNPLQWVVGAYYLHATEPLELYQNSGPDAQFDAIHTNEAVFASITYKFSPEWSVTLGGRYSHDNLPYHESPFPAVGNFDTTDSKPTGAAKLNWQATRDTLLYASVSSGYKAGGVNLQLPALGFTPAPFQPETNVVEEIGVKTTMFDNHLRIDGDIFDSQYKHYQLQENTPEGLPLTQGPGDARIYGSEIEFTGAFNDLQFNVGAAYLHATVPGDFPFTLPNGTTTTITAGTVIPFAPEWMLSTGVQYDFHVLGGTLTPRLQFQYQGSQYTNIEHVIPLAFPYGDLSDVVIPQHGTADFRLKYAATDHWGIEGYVMNLTGKVYESNVILSTGNAAPDISYGAPRQYGARLTYRW